MKIQVERQNGPECALATVAALSGKPLAEIRVRACALAGTATWDEATKDSLIYWRAMNHLANELGLGRMVHNWRMVLGGMVAGTAKLPGKGRGSVMIKGDTGAHVMAYQAGKVHDSNFPERGGVSLEEAMKAYPGYALVGITPLLEDYRRNACPTCEAPAGKPCTYPSGYAFSAGHASRKAS